MPQQILIYKGAGANACCLRALSTQLRNLPVKLVDHVGLDEPWEAETQLLIFPGGRDIPYHNALKGPINARIRTFVEQGGRYLGICAGGYYGSQIVEFEKGHPLEVVATRELAFFPGIASGPAYGAGQFRYETEEGSKIALLTLPHDQTSTAYFNGGCTFLDATSHPNINILARYQDLPQQPAAIIECLIGKGSAILSGVHPEYPLPHCAASETQRKSLFNSLLQRLEIHATP